MKIRCSLVCCTVFLHTLNTAFVPVSHSSSAEGGNDVQLFMFASTLFLFCMEDVKKKVDIISSILYVVYCD